jgi:cytosine/creatinine deaminase
MDLVIRGARILQAGELRTVDIGLQGAAVAAISPALEVDAPELNAAGCLVVPGLIETHIHLDKTCILDRCRIEGTVAEAVRETAADKSARTTPMPA